MTDHAAEVSRIREFEYDGEFVVLHEGSEVGDDVGVAQLLEEER